MKKAETLTLALCIALLPPIWAVAAPYLNVTTGAVALICAGLCAANGDKTSDAVKVSIGFLLGDFWAYLAVWVMDVMPFHPDAELFGTLFVLGGLAVLLSSLAPQMDFLPGLAMWVGHWADHYGSGWIFSDWHLAPSDCGCHVGGCLVCGRTAQQGAFDSVNAGCETAQPLNGGY